MNGCAGVPEYVEPQGGVQGFFRCAPLSVDATTRSSPASPAPLEPTLVIPPPPALSFAPGSAGAQALTEFSAPIIRQAGIAALRDLLGGFLEL